jgi:hypothetical protein
MGVQLRTRRIAATVGMALAAGAALTACQGSATGSVTAGGAAGSGGASASAVASAGGGSTGSTGTTGGAGTSAPSAAPTGGGSGSGSGGSGSSGGSSGTTTTSATGAGCRTSNLGFSFGPDSGAQSVGSQGGIGVVLTNRGSGSCTLHGFPGVDIVSKSGAHWSLTRQSKGVGTVTLRSGATASFEITYLPFDSANPGESLAFNAVSLLVTPPGETHSATLKWDGFADVMDQSGATHPGTYVGPVVAGNGS